MVHCVLGYIQRLNKYSLTMGRFRAGHISYPAPFAREIVIKTAIALPHIFSFFSASIVLSFLILFMAYSIVINTTRNTLPAAMAMLYHGT